MEHSARQLRISRVLHAVGDVTSRASASAFVAVAVVTFLVALGIAGFPAGWQTMFATVSAAITLVMVFVIQHTQSRQQATIQLKLDELVRASPEADDLLVHIEAAPDEELIALEISQIEHHASVREV